MKRCSTSFNIREMRIKTTKRCSFTFTRMAKIKRETITRVSEDVEKLKPSCTSSAKRKMVHCSTLINRLAISLKVKHTVTIWPSNCTLGHLSKRNENLGGHKNFYLNVHSTFIHNSPKPETTQMSSEVHGQTHCGSCTPWNPTQQSTGVNYWHMEQCRWVSRKLCFEKEANTKRLHTVCFHLHTIFGKTKF